MSQFFSTYEQQLNKLMSEKKLLISHKDSAIKTLEQLSYYSLIGGYKKPFMHVASGNYTHGVTFEEIVALYHFDEELRILFLKYILRIERHMKSLISYCFCEKYGEKQQEYLNPRNYALTKKNNDEVNKLIYSIQKAISLPSRYTYITHHANKYGNVPLWVTMNTLTFGQTSKIYQYIPNTMIHKKLSIKQKNEQYIMGKQDLFSVIIALYYLIEKSEFKHFKSELSKLIAQVLKKCPHLSQQQFLEEMGFPENWAKITRYKK